MGAFERGNIMIEILEHSVFDLIKIIPFLFISFIVMELLEHKLKNKSKFLESKKYGPLVGAGLGIIPQCGFSAIGANLYAARVITLGTLMTVFLTTSDEMLPILLASDVEVEIIFKILLIKFLIGLLFGIIIDFIWRKKANKMDFSMCKDEDCHCHNNIFKSSLVHTVKISLFILLINIILELIIDEEMVSSFLTSSKIITPIIASIVGLIPNCASSVIITELYVSEVLNLGSCIAGLLSGSGVGILILFKQNKNLLENMMIVGLLILIASVSGIVINLI